MKQWLEQISIVAIRQDGADQALSEPWRASRFDGDRKLVPMLDADGNVVIDPRSQDNEDPIYIPNPEQLCSFGHSVAFDLRSDADVDLAVVLIAKVASGPSITMTATLQVPLPARGTCSVELVRGGNELVQHQMQLSAFEPSTVKTAP